MREPTLGRIIRDPYERAAFGHRPHRHVTTCRRRRRKSLPCDDGGTGGEHAGSVSGLGGRIGDDDLWRRAVGARRAAGNHPDRNEQPQGSENNQDGPESAMSPQLAPAPPRVGAREAACPISVGTTASFRPGFARPRPCSLPIRRGCERGPRRFDRPGHGEVPRKWLDCRVGMGWNADTMPTTPRTGRSAGTVRHRHRLRRPRAGRR